MILVVGAMYSLNYGDGVICKTVSDIIKHDLGLQTSIFGISGKNEYPSRTEISVKNEVIRNKISKQFPISFYLKYKRRLRLKKELNKINSNKYQAVVFAGGQLFMECFMDYICTIVKWANTNNIPVIFNSCGLGKIKNWSRLEFQRLLKYNNIKGISLRDGFKQFNHLYKCNCQIERVYDPVVEVSRFYQPVISQKVELGIGIIHFSNFRKDCVAITKNEYCEIIRMIVEYCLKHDINFELFTNGDSLDNNYCLELARELNCINRVSPRPESPNKLIDNIVKYERIISCRLHSHIIATSYGIPTVAIVWDTKVREFMELIKRSNMCLSLDKEVKYEEIETLLLKLFSIKLDITLDAIPLASESLNKILSIK